MVSLKTSVSPPCPHSLVQYILVAMLSFRGSSHPGIKSESYVSPAVAGEFFTTSAIWKAWLYSIFIKNNKKADQNVEWVMIRNTGWSFQWCYSTVLESYMIAWRDLTLQCCLHELSTLHEASEELGATAHVQ